MIFTADGQLLVSFPLPRQPGGAASSGRGDRQAAVDRRSSRHRFLRNLRASQFGTRNQVDALGGCECNELCVHGESLADSRHEAFGWQRWRWHAAVRDLEYSLRQGRNVS